MPQSNVVITGMGVVSAIGIGCDDFFESLLEKKSAVTSLLNRVDDRCEYDGTPEPAGLWVGAPILDFEAKQFVKPRKAMKVMCREIQTAFAASLMALDHAGLDSFIPATAESVLKPRDFGTVFGSEIFYGSPLELSDSIRPCIQDDGQIDTSQFGNSAMKQIVPLWMLKYLPNMPACHVGIYLNAHGPNNSIILGDVSGPSALIEAASCVDRGIAKVVVTGGTGTRIGTTRLNFRADYPMAESFEPVENSSRPHDPTSVGVVGGEGAAAMIIESEELAKQRGAQPLVRVVSHASRFVGAEGMRTPMRCKETSDVGMRSSSAAIESAIETALRDAGIRAEDLGLYVSHGTGDPVADAAEQVATQATLAGVPCLSTVASIGHTGSGCGSIDLVAGAMALNHNVIPPTRVDQRLQPLAHYVEEPTRLEGDFVLCICHNTEGNATAIVLGRA
ncbi:MAG: beta-ketoacyl-[acyl-carrier-protein] synthase family protein [Rubripirellula sp.]